MNLMVRLALPAALPWLAGPADTQFTAFPVDRNRSTWKVQEYIREWIDRTNVLDAEGIGKDGPIFQAGAFVAPGSITNDTSWNFRTIADGGILNTGMAKSYAGHQVSPDPDIPQRF